MAGTQPNSIARVYDSLQGRNRIINGDCRVQQRPSIAVTSGNSGYGGPDRYLCRLLTTPGGTCTQSSATLTYNNVVKPAVLQSVTSVATNLTTVNYWSGITQYIEGYNCYDLIGQPITISFIFQANNAGTYSVALRDSGGTYSYVTNITVVAASVPQQFVIFIPAIPTAASIPCSNAIGLQLWIGAQNSGGTYATSVLNSWQTGNYITSNSTFPWATTSGAAIALTDLQLEVGTIATPFERRTVTEVIQQCYRYYETGTIVIQAPAAGQMGTILSIIPKRGTPAVALSGVAYGNGSGLSAPNIFSNQIFFSFTASVSGGFVSGSWTASTEF